MRLKMKASKRRNHDVVFRMGQRGFSTIDVVIAAVILMLVAAIAIPQITGTMRAYRALSDARSLASLLALAKMRAANSFTQAEVTCDTIGKSCQLQLCSSKGVSSCAAFAAEGGPLNLSQGDSFGFGSISTPAGSQTTIQNSSAIIFNSRGIPVDNTGAPTANSGFYVTNQSGDTYAVTVYATGRVAVWRYGSNTWRVQ